MCGAVPDASLRTYSDNVGITYYLIWKLCTSFSREEVDFYWPQYWCVGTARCADDSHLLVTRPSESRALESFILRRCEDSVHTALLVRVRGRRR